MMTNPMRKYLILIPFALILAGIVLTKTLDFSQYPTQAVDGTPWSTEWEMMAKVLGIESPGAGFVLQDNTSVLAGDDTYYATWVYGEPRPFVNADGDETDLYDAQFYVLLYGCGGSDYAREAQADFLARERSVYDIHSESTAVHAGQEYTVITYDCVSPTNPYERGASAFVVFDNYVMAAELTCTDRYTGDEAAMLAQFLDGCHFGRVR